MIHDRTRKCEHGVSVRPSLHLVSVESNGGRSEDRHLRPMRPATSQSTPRSPSLCRLARSPGGKHSVPARNNRSSSSPSQTVFSPKGVDLPVTPHVSMGRPAAGPASTLLVLAPLAQTRRLRVTQPQLVTELSSPAIPKDKRSRSRHPVSPRDACSEKPNPCHNSAMIDDRATVPVTPR